ncbi:hypothetical protein PAMP_011019 [Pampus punctatissimus]
MPLRCYGCTSTCFVGTDTQYDCEKIWTTFEQAYVGKDPCKVPMENYNPLFNEYAFKIPKDKVNLIHHTTVCVTGAHYPNIIL